jgi:hypothetical protein
MCASNWVALSAIVWTAVCLPAGIFLGRQLAIRRYRRTIADRAAAWGSTSEIANKL